MRFQFPTDIDITEVFVSPDICEDAYFKLDKPLRVEGEFFRIIDGQFFIERLEGLERIQGRWRRKDIQVIEAENRRVRAEDTSKDIATPKSK